MTGPAQDSQTITRKSGSNLALSFFSLPTHKRAAMSSFYAFCRVVDDIVDETKTSNPAKKAELQRWRDEIRACYAGTPATEIGQELAQMIRQFLIPPRPFFDILDGVEMDIEKSRYATFAELERYCYRVASAVGLVSIEIFQYTHPRTREYAVALGMAFQLTNILRDVGHDLSTFNRIYLPADEMSRWGVTEADLRQGNYHAGVMRLLRWQHFRAEHFFQKAARLLPESDRPNMTAAMVMTEVYHDLLDYIAQSNYRVLGPSLRLPPWRKARTISHARRSIRHSPPSRPTPQSIAVWGGGFAGISTALHLARRGHRVSLFESRPFLGGRAHSFRDAKTGLTLDNGQHIFMGCYEACLELFQWLGVQDRLDAQPHLRVPYVSQRRGRSELKAAPLPAPWHLFIALTGFRELSLQDKGAILRLGLQLRLGNLPKADETVEAWLTRLRQTPGARRALWEPLCVAALNEPLSSASASLFCTVLRQSIFGPRKAANILMARHGLSDLTMPELGWFLEGTGGSLHLGETIQTVKVQNGSVISFTTNQKEYAEFDAVISALPWHALRKLFPENPPVPHLHEIPSSSIIGIQLLVNRPVLDVPFVGLLDSPLHWVFDRSATLPKDRPPGETLLAAIISASNSLLNQSSEELTHLAVSEIRKHFPANADFQVLHSFVFKSRDATFAATPHTEKLRPGPTTPIHNLYLAGDWIRTGYPATLEGAAWSGRQVAQLF